ncbi:hypothetical protein TNCT1_58590 [Streptomyces sp. 1-11]|nr:hypothetical protein TNCT1_58590 [Streptomyces sp. 1-11]
MPRALGDDGAAEPEAGRVAEILDGGDLTQFFDDSGEHFPGPPASWGTDSGACRRRQNEREDDSGATPDRDPSACGRAQIRRRAWEHARPPRTASHPDFNRRSRNFTWSTGRWKRPGRGL